MGCLYCAWGGVCQFYDEVEHSFVEDFKDTEYGFSAEGYCVIEDDECPSDNCDAYENIDPDEENEEYLND